MFVDESKSHQNGKTYTRALIRDSYRENGKVKHRTIANISKCTPEEINAIRLALKYKGKLADFIVDEDIVHSDQGLSVGAVFVLHKIARELGIVKALGSTEEAKLSLWMVLARLIAPGSRLGNVRLAQQHAAVDVIGLDAFNEDDLYHALDWIGTKQHEVEIRIFQARHSEKKPKLFLYDVTSSYLEGMKNELGAWGYNRDKKKGKMQIVFGLLTDEDGWPISTEVFQGNTQDPKTVFNQVKKLVDRFGCEHVTMVGDRGMIKSAQIKDLSEEEFFYITAITKPQIETLLNQGKIQMELFTEELFEVEYDKIRYVLRRNPVRAEELEETRKSKMKKVELLIEEKNRYLDEHRRSSETVAVRIVNELISRLKLSDFLSVSGSDRILTLVCDDDARAVASRLDGCYVIKTNVPGTAADATAVHQRYKDLAQVENAFRTVKTTLEIRPLYLRNELRTRGHVFAVMLSFMIEKYLREKWWDLDVTVKEGIEELSSINSIKVHVGAVIYNQIPNPRKLGAQLLEALNITLPKAIGCRDVKVATRKKLSIKRKKL